MRKSKLALFGLLPMLLLLTACSSSPRSNHYVLTSHKASDPQTDSPVVGIRPVGVPAYLKRSNLVSELDGNAVNIASLDVWAEPLDTGIQRVVALNLATLLNSRQIILFPWHPSRAPQYAVEVRLVSLNVTESAGKLVAQWQIYRPGTAASVARSVSRLQQAVGTEFSASDVPALYSDLFYQLSEVIAAAIQEDLRASEGT